MLVGNRMSRNPVITRPETTVPKALAVMRGSNVRRLPVVNDKGKLVGIVSLLDLLRASPSPVTSLDQWELHYLLEKLKVDEVMTRDVVTVTEDTPIEEAGRLMVDKKISGLPVLRDGELLGIITESDLFKILLELFGAGQPGVRLTVKMPLVRGGMAKLSTAVAERGGRFVAFGESMDQGVVTFKVSDIRRDELIETIEPMVTSILDVRES